MCSMHVFFFFLLLFLLGLMAGSWRHWLAASLLLKLQTKNFHWISAGETSQSILLEGGVFLHKCHKWLPSPSGASQNSLLGCNSPGIFRWDQSPPLSFHPSASAGSFYWLSNLNSNGLSSLFGCTIAVALSSFLLFSPSYTRMQDKHETARQTETSLRLIGRSVSLALTQDERPGAGCLESAAFLHHPHAVKSSASTAPLAVWCVAPQHSHFPQRLQVWHPALQAACN